jgi:hypothetical protein
MRFCGSVIAATRWFRSDNSLWRSRRANRGSLSLSACYIGRSFCRSKIACVCSCSRPACAPASSYAASVRAWSFSGSPFVARVSKRSVSVASRRAARARLVRSP